MRILLLGLFLFFYTNTYSLVIQDPKIEIPTDREQTTFDIIPPYNPLSIPVPSTERLSQVSSRRVLDMGASAYSRGFLMKALYFYTNAIALFPDESTVIAWANYESAYIYFNRRNYVKALEHLDTVLEIRGAPSTVQNLARQLSGRIRNKKEFDTLRKQEDVLFVADKKARAALDKQIAKEEREAARVQRALTKERRRREKEEQKLLREQEKAEQRRLKEEQKAEQRRLKEEQKALKAQEQ